MPYGLNAGINKRIRILRIRPMCVTTDQWLEFDRLTVAWTHSRNAS